MSLYILDTDILSLYQLGNAAVRQKITKHPPADLAVTIITVEEQLSGWYTLRRRVKGREQLARVYERFADNVRFLAHLQIASFPESAIQRYEDLLRMKLGVRANDLRIAAIALDLAATIVTRNLRDFQCVPSLMVENWSA
jgi:tRNA(fMet)-specific endonuclease VapC